MNILWKVVKFFLVEGSSFLYTIFGYFLLIKNFNFKIGHTDDLIFFEGIIVFVYLTIQFFQAYLVKGNSEKKPFIDIIFSFIPLLTIIPAVVILGYQGELVMDKLMIQLFVFYVIGIGIDLCFTLILLKSLRQSSEVSPTS